MNEKRKKILANFTVEELKNRVTFWTVRRRLVNEDRELYKLKLKK